MLPKWGQSAVFGTYFVIREKATYLNVDELVADERAETGCLLT
jgi:hypothetical protein